jgi:3-hydroxybutyryl-CoA dehydrogenase
MGSGIAEVAARAGQRVVVLETTEDLVKAGRARIERSLGTAVDRGKLASRERDEILGRIQGTTDPAAFAHVELVIEAATEDRATKLELFRRLAEVTGPEVVLASNTSSIPIVDLATATDRPDRVLGLHFFNPVPVMGVVEIVRALTTSEETVAFGRSYCQTLGKATVLSKDRDGFIVNTLLIPYLNHAIAMVEEGFASPEDVDAAIHLGLNHPMGPLALADLIGLDTCLQIANVLYDEFKDPRFAPPPMLRRLVAAGHLGRKTGRGFYPYDA